MNDPEPQPGDGPDYHAEHAAWARRQPYTPSRIEVQCRYQEWAGGSSSDDARREEFDRWLEAHDREVLLKAAQEARERGDIGHPEGMPAEDWLEGVARRLGAL